MALAARLLAPAARRAARLVLSDSTDAVTNLAIEDWLFRKEDAPLGVFQREKLAAVGPTTAAGEKPDEETTKEERARKVVTNPLSTALTTNASARWCGCRQSSPLSCVQASRRD